ncbi:outer membrane beta-barrel protein [Pedobacter hartonius]|uniref:Outer membrane protein beta-barrel domain-containing protein n=1 Tax=Pedobacter hartonius TaxID=425514 RepID=A0A1H3ZVZ5_9SPHI|nr:outer membrane beta-barrel protein [Pedobacter hartonius]SEA27464.1 Outer membrane protein beta-barrel domain-containing protein [Pedobacter hartonius]
MKRIIICILVLASARPLFAQSNFYKFSVGGGVAATQSFTEVQKHSFGFAGYGTLDYLFTPFLSLGIEVQKGEINGGNYKTSWLNREFVNSYKALNFNAKVSLGAILDGRYNGPSDLLKGLYIGTGIGAIHNDVLYSTGLDPEDRNYATICHVTSKDIYFPFNLGINVHFADGEGFYRYVLNFNYQGNLTLGEGLDGYDDSRNTFRSGTLDVYTFFSVGVKYNFGTMGLSRKTWRKY